MLLGLCLEISFFRLWKATQACGIKLAFFYVPAPVSALHWWGPHRPKQRQPCLQFLWKHSTFALSKVLAREYDHGMHMEHVHWTRRVTDSQPQLKKDFKDPRVGPGGPDWNLNTTLQAIGFRFRRFGQTALWNLLLETAGISKRTVVYIWANFQMQSMIELYWFTEEFASFFSTGRLRLNSNPLNLVRWIDSWPFDKTWKPGWNNSTWGNRFNGRAVNLEWIFIMTPSRARKSFPKASPYFFTKLARTEYRYAYDGDRLNAVRLFRVISEDAAERDSLDESSAFLIEGTRCHLESWTIFFFLAGPYFSQKFFLSASRQLSDTVQFAGNVKRNIPFDTRSWWETRGTLITKSSLFEQKTKNRFCGGGFGWDVTTRDFRCC